jgi:hypothetical protein
VTVHSDTATGALQDRPMADAGLTSYRYPSRYGGYIMIGATDADDALREAKRSMSEGTPVLAKLEIWNVAIKAYVPFTA